METPTAPAKTSEPALAAKPVAAVASGAPAAAPDAQKRPAPESTSEPKRDVKVQKTEPKNGLEVPKTEVEETVDAAFDEEEDDDDYDPASLNEVKDEAEQGDEESSLESYNDDDADDDVDDDDSVDDELQEVIFDSDSDKEGAPKLWELDPLPPLEDIPLTKSTCHQARTFLKTEGHVKFLDLFVPNDPTADDIIRLTELLGYMPNDVEKVRESNGPEDFLHRCIVFLREAINRVLKSRTRLPDFHTIDDLCKALQKAQNVLVLTGAGISTSLGIPDFRSSKGFYAKMRYLGLDDPQDVFSIDVFREDPKIFYSIAHMILPPDNAFTPLHAFIKLLQDKGKLLRNYTQNIDNLEANAGVLPEKLVQCHGSFATASCVTCKYKVPGEVLFPNLRAQEIAYCPFCKSERKALLQRYDKMEDEGQSYSSRRFDEINSFGVMKPDITFFGEDLPDRYHNTIREDIKKCDLLLCIGTSLKVAPVSEIVNRVPNDVPQILINRDPIDHCEFDVEMLGYCDQCISWLAGENLKWKINHKDFDKILQSGLQMDVLDESFGSYMITDAEQRQKLQEQAKAEAAQALAEEQPINNETEMKELQDVKQEVDRMKERRKAGGPLRREDEPSSPLV